MNKMKLIILRVLTADGTFGLFLDPSGMPFAVTAELPWLDNKKKVSCIPDGNYVCHRVDSPHHGNTFEVLNVKGRSNILFHVANVPTEDLLGCIGVGEKFEDVHGKHAIQESRLGFDEFIRITSVTDEFDLEIKTVHGGK